jgi:IcmF-related N-terminal domain
MVKVIAKPLEFLKALWNLAFPMFAAGQAASAAHTPAGWIARISLLAIVLVILAVINQADSFGLSSWVSSPAIRRIWLPLFACCLYVMLWLGWWLYRVLSRDIEPVSSEFPDVDRAWSQALEALNREEIHLDAVPLFLVLGWPSKTESALFQAAGIKAHVKQVPSGVDEPLHVTANRDGIWLTCPGASLLGQYNPTVLGDRSADVTLAGKTEDTGDPFKSIGIGQGGGETLRVEDFLASFKQAQAHAQARAAAKSKQVSDRDSHLERLRHLAGLICRDRAGFCPVNGVLVTLPIATVDARSYAEEVAAACRADLIAAFGVFRMRCPVLVMICGLEDVPGFTEVVDHLPADQVRKRMGQRFPLLPDLPPAALPERIEGAVESITGGVFPPMVFTLFQIEAPNDENPEAVLRQNCQLFRFLSAMQGKAERLAHLVRDCLPKLPGDPLMFGGCYFAATGLNSANEQAFASGVLMRLIREDQDNVTWTEETLHDDTSAWRQARLVKIALGLVIALGILAGIGIVVSKTVLKGSSSPTSAPGDEGVQTSR